MRSKGTVRRHVVSLVNRYRAEYEKNHAAQWEAEWNAKHEEEFKGKIIEQLGLKEFALKLEKL